MEDQYKTRKVEVLKKLARKFKNIKKELERFYSELILWAPETYDDVAISDIMDDIYAYLKDAQIDCEDYIELLTGKKPKKNVRDEERKADEEFLAMFIAAWGNKDLGD